MVPDFARNWFDNILAIFICMLVGWLITYIVNVNLFTIVSLIMSPLTNFAQTLPGVIFMTFVMDFFYYFGVSGWVFTTVTSPIQNAAIAANMDAAAAGGIATNINTYGFTCGR